MWYKLLVDNHCLPHCHIAPSHQVFLAGQERVLKCQIVFLNFFAARSKTCDPILAEGTQSKVS